MRRFLSVTLAVALACLPLRAATIMFSGFEGGDTTEVAIEGTSSYQTGTVRTGTYAFRSNPTTTGTGDAQLQALAANGSQSGAANVPTSYVRFYFRYATKPASTSEAIIGAKEITTSTFKFVIRLTSGGNLATYRADNATLLATGSTTLSSGTWYLIETKVGTGASTAPWEVKINGVSEISGTANLTANNTDSFYIGKYANVNGQSVDFFYDDVLWSDSAYPGAGQCSALITSANGTYQTATIGAGAGSHYQIVQTIPYLGDTSYLVTSGTNGNNESESVQTRLAAGLSVSSVNSVKAYIVTERDNASNAVSIKTLLRSNTTDVVNASGRSQGIVYGGNEILTDTDPATSSGWLAAALDTLQVGLQNSTTNKARFTVGAIFVDYVPTPSATADEAGYVH